MGNTNRNREWVKCVCCGGTGTSYGMTCFYCDGAGGFETEPDAEPEPEPEPEKDNKEERL